MSFQSLLVHVGFGSDCEPRIRLASLADDFGAGLIGFAAGGYLPVAEQVEPITADALDRARGT